MEPKRKPGRPKALIPKKQVKIMVTPETHQKLTAAGRPGTIMAAMAEEWAKS